VFKDFEGADAGASAVIFGSDNNYYTIVPVPEPATWLGSLALLGLVVYRERRLLGSFKGSRPSS
jgi:hypothetical protein